MNLPFSCEGGVSESKDIRFTIMYDKEKDRIEGKNWIWDAEKLLLKKWLLSNDYIKFMSIYLYTCLIAAALNASVLPRTGICIDLCINVVCLRSAHQTVMKELPQSSTVRHLLE